MGTLRERGTRNAITALLISALMWGIHIFVMRGGVKIGIQVFGNLQRQLANIHPLAVVRMGGMLMIKPSPRSPGVSFGVLVILWPVLTAATSQGKRLD